MKKLFLLSLLASVVVTFAGCEKPEPEQPEEPGQEQPAPEVGKITLESDEALVFSDNGESHEVSFEATLDWAAAASEDFVTVNPASGKAGDAKVTVTVSANESYDPRTATLTLTSGEDQKTIQITQKQKGALLLTGSTISVAAEGGKVTVVAKANSNVTATIADNAKGWITEVKSKGLVDYTFDFDVAVNEVEQPRTGQIVFTNESGSETVTIEQAAAAPKVTVFAASFATGSELKWENGDKINVNGVESAALALSAPAATSEFTVEQVLAAPYKALYPVSAVKDAQTVTIAQSYAAGEPSWKSLPMVAYSAEAKTLEFAPLFSAVKVTVNKAAERAYTNVAYVEFSGLNNESVTGDFTVDFAKKTLTGAANAGKTVRYNVNAELGTEALNVYVVLPAGSYSKGYVIKVADSQGNVVEVTEENLTLTAGQVYTVPAFEYAAPAPVAPAVPEIASAAELMAFIASYNNGDAPATVVIKNDFAFSDEENAAFQSINNLTTIIDGNNCTISNFNSGKSLAVETSASASINNLTIAGAAALEGGDADKYVATFAGVHGGKIAGCTNKVSYTVAGTQSAGTLYVGGFAGKMAAGSEVANSTSEASIYVTTGTAGAAYVGAVAGYNEGAIKACVVNAVADEAKPSQICGVDESRQIAGTVLVSGTTLMNSWIGGFAGLATVTSVIEGCTNNSDIATNFYKGDANPEISYVAGIAAENAGEVSGCTNNGALALYSAETTRYAAGIVGLNKEGAAVRSCTNTAGITNGNSGAPAYGANVVYTAGIIAVNESANVSDLTNSGKIEVARMKTDNSAVISMGGCFGELKVSLDGNNKITNSGNITWSETKNCTSTIGYAIGGVAGRIYGSLSNVSNTGKVIFTGKTKATTGKNVYLGGIAGMNCGTGEMTMSGNVNSGYVQFDAQPASGEEAGKRTYIGIYVGGILGYNPEAALTIENCSNSGYVHTGINNKHTKTANKYIGGIVGYLKGASAVKSCAMTGAIYNDDFNNNLTLANGAVTGGIVGVTEGAEGARIKVENCTVKTAAAVKDRYVAARRGWLGGIVGYAAYTDVTKCNHGSLLSGSFYFSGGVCGEMVASTATECTVECNQESSQLYAGGGLAGVMDGTSVLDNCTVKGGISTTSANSPKLGQLVASAAAGATVKNCQYKCAFSYSTEDSKGNPITVTTGVIAEDSGAVLSGNTEITE